jgi:hypothetical protein
LPPRQTIEMSGGESTCGRLSSNQHLGAAPSVVRASRNRNFESTSLRRRSEQRPEPDRLISRKHAALRIAAARDTVRSLPHRERSNQCRKRKSHKRWSCSI